MRLLTWLLMVVRPISPHEGEGAARVGAEIRPDGLRGSIGQAVCEVVANNYAGRLFAL